MSAPTLMSAEATRARSTASASRQATASTPTLLRHLPLPDTCPPPEAGPLDTVHERPEGRGQQGAAGVQGILRLVGAGCDDEDDFGPVATRRADLPDPLAWSRGLVQVLVEVVGGRRPASQLLRWTTPGVYDQVRRMAAMPAPAGAAAGPARSLSATRRPAQARPGARPSALQRSAVTSVRVCEPADGVAEVSAVVSGPVRSRALALRLEGRDGRWKVTALQTA